MIESTHWASSSSLQLEQRRKARLGATLLVLTRLGCSEQESSPSVKPDAMLYMRSHLHLSM